MSWIITGTEKLPSDPDAAAYIASVEAADGQVLEYDVRMAINAFVRGCKVDGIWSAIKASCILAGARTLNGALVPLAGTAPTNFNFVSGDYNRKTGLVGNGSTKYLNSNRNNNADPQNSNHNAVWASSIGTLVDGDAYMGVDTNAVNRNELLVFSNIFTARNRRAIALSTGIAPSTGLLAVSRQDSTVLIRVGGSAVNFSQDPLAPTADNVLIFRRSTPGSNINARLAFYSIGESLDLALLDNRVTTLINAFAAAIP